MDETFKTCSWHFNSLKPEQNDRSADIFKCIRLNEDFSILLAISLKFAPAYEGKPGMKLALSITWTNDDL